MADWKTQIELGDIHHKFESGEMTIQQVGQELAKRLRASPYADDLDQEIGELECVDDPDDYDEILSDLYDFGDWDHRIWFNPN